MMPCGGNKKNGSYNPDLLKLGSDPLGLTMDLNQLPGNIYKKPETTSYSPQSDGYMSMLLSGPKGQSSGGMGPYDGMSKIQYN